MELQALRTFVEVVRQNGFSRAAKAIFSTQSTVSKAIKQLEYEVRAPLLNRVGHHRVGHRISNRSKSVGTAVRQAGRNLPLT
jgi:DNA-binding transcriptional LysR family regulator